MILHHNCSWPIDSGSTEYIEGENKVDSFKIALDSDYQFDKQNKVLYILFLSFVQL